MIPLHILTGFLGSGKTTLLAALLRDPGGERIAALVNEAGDLPLDDLLLERVDEDVLMLASGCACCTVRGDLYEAVSRMVRLGPTRILFETTGLADPAPILHSFAADPRLSESVSVAGVITVADAIRIETLLDEQPEARRQLEFADRIVLTKTDMAPQRIDSVLERLTAEAPGREVRIAEHGRVEPEWLLASAPLSGVRSLSEASRWLHHHSSEASFHTHTVTVEDPASIDIVQLWLRLVTQIDGPRLLRIKALVECAETGDVFALQSAGRAVSPPRRLPQRPAGLRGARVVIIERGLGDRASKALLQSLEDALHGTPTASS